MDHSNIGPPSYKRQSDSLQSDNPILESLVPESPGLSSFNVNLNDDDVGGSSSQWPIGGEKSKIKEKGRWISFSYCKYNQRAESKPNRSFKRWSVKEGSKLWTPNDKSSKWDKKLRCLKDFKLDKNEIKYRCY